MPRKDIGPSIQYRWQWSCNGYIGTSIKYSYQPYYNQYNDSEVSCKWQWGNLKKGKKKEEEKKGIFNLRFLKMTKVLEWFEWRSLYPVRVSDILQWLDWTILCNEHAQYISCIAYMAYWIMRFKGNPGG